MELPLLVLRIFLGLTLLLASVPKLLGPNEFRRALANYRLLPWPLVKPVAVWLPRLELLIGVALLTGTFTTVAGAFAAVALLAFSLGVAANLARGRRIECGCYGGVSPRRISWSLVLKDLLLAGAATAVAVEPPATWQAFAWPTANGAAASSSAAVAAAVVALGAISFEQLGAEWVRLRVALRDTSGTTA